MTWKQDAFQFSTLVGWFKRLCFSPFCSVILTAVLWTQEEWFRSFGSSGGRTSRAPHAEEPPASASCKEPAQGLVVTSSCSWRLATNLSVRQDFQRSLRRSLKPISKDPQHASISECGPDSSIGVVDKISLYARPPFHRQQSSFCICTGSWSFLFLLLTTKWRIYVQYGQK